jgi:hypothetical protein
MSNDDALAKRANQIEEAARTAHGKDNWESALRSLGRQVADGKLEEGDLVKKMGRRDAVDQLFYEGIPNAEEKDWRAWRDSQPRRKARIDSVKR